MCQKSKVAQKFKFPKGLKTDESYLHHFLWRFLAFPRPYRCLKAANDVVIARWFALSLVFLRKGLFTPKLNSAIVKDSLSQKYHLRGPREQKHINEKIHRQLYK